MTDVSAPATTVRFDAVPAVRLIRPVFRALDRLAPAASVALATRIWCTPPRRRARGDRPRPAGGHRSTVRVAGRDLAMVTWTAGDPDARRPIVYLVHGWGGWQGQLDAFVAPLVAAGYRVVAFDAPSHGESERGTLGRQSTLSEMASALAAVVESVGPAYGIVAHSLGGTAAMLAVLDRLAVGRLVSIAAPASPLAHTREFARVLGFGERTRTGLLRRVEHLIGRPTTDLDLPARLRSATGLPPLLLIHDRADKEAPYPDASTLAAGWPRSDLAPTDGLGHRRILRDPGVVRRTVAYLDEGLG